MNDSKKGGDRCNQLTAAEIEFLDWYDLQDALLQAVVDLLFRQARKEGNGFFDQFGINSGSDCFDVSLSVAA